MEDVLQWKGICRLMDRWHALPATKKTTRALKLVVLLDFFGVASLVPLLPNYFATVGCGNERLALISSAYNLSQLVGGVALGWLSDGILPRKIVLMISLLGSTAAYGSVGMVRSFHGLVLSRIMVGLVKQTMTISQAMVADLRESRANRTKHGSHLQAAATLAFIVGPALGGWLYFLSPRLPPLVAATSFFLASAVCLFAVPAFTSKAAQADALARRNMVQEGLHRLVMSLQEGLGFLKGDKAVWFPFSTLTPRSPSPVAKELQRTTSWRPLPPLAMRVLAMRVMSSFMVMALTPLHFVGFLEARYGLRKHQLGYLTSYRALLAFLAQTFIISLLARRHTFSEEATAKGALIALMLIKAFDVFSIDQGVYLMVSTPVTVIAYSLLDSSIKGIYTDAVPPGHRGTALGSIGIFHSMLGIVAPLYGGFIFDRLQSVAPTVIFGHYVFLLVAFCFLLPPSQLKEVHHMRRMAKEHDEQGQETLTAQQNEQQQHPPHVREKVD